MLNNVSLRTKLLIAFLALSILPFAVIGGISVFTANKALSDLAFGQLESLREVKKTQIEMFFQERQRNMGALLETVSIFKQAAFNQMHSVQEVKKAQLEGMVQKWIDDMTVLSADVSLAGMTGFEMLLDGQGGMKLSTLEMYEEQHFGDALQRIARQYGYADLMLITVNGNIVYTVARGTDLGKNVLKETWKDPSLTTCFQQGLHALTLQDFAPYSPAENQYRAFLSAPVVDPMTQKAVGVVVFSIAPQEVNAIVQRRDGMGETGESYLVGSAAGVGALRSDQALRGGRIGAAVTGAEVDLALAGQAGELVKAGYAGQMEIVRCDPLTLPGLQWSLITSMSLKEVIAPKQEGQTEDYFTRFIQQYGYSDLALIHPDGTVFYTVARAADYMSNLSAGPAQDNGLGRAFQAALTSKTLAFSDVQPYPAAQGAAVAFLAQPILNQEEVELVVAVQIPIDVINAVMLTRAGMGRTGETYVVGQDQILRSDSYLAPDRYSVRAMFADPAQRRIDTPASQAALAGQQGTRLTRNYLDRAVLSAYTPLNIFNTTWALIAEIDRAEALTAVRQLEQVLGGVAGVVLLGVVIASFLVSRSSVRFFQYLITYIDRLAKGDVPEAMTGAYSGEFRAVVHNLNAMSAKLTQVVRDGKSAAQDVAQRSREMSVAAEQMSKGAAEQAAATEEVSASMEEMAANIRQTADNARLTEGMAVASAEDARAGRQAVTEIIQAMEVIAERISLVQEIASQTNMLSLNATIEAAKAQDFGKGFSVVASSVRDLARQSRAAADEIRTLVHSCVALSAQAGDILQRLTPNSEKTAELVQEINAASQEQSTGVEHVNQAMQQLDNATQQNAATAEELAATTEALTIQADALQQTMAFFTVTAAQPVSQIPAEDLQQRLQELEQQLAELRGAALPPTPKSSESRTAAHDRAIDLGNPNAAGDERDQEFERY